MSEFNDYRSDQLVTQENATGSTDDDLLSRRAIGATGQSNASRSESTQPAQAPVAQYQQPIEAPPPVHPAVPQYISVPHYYASPQTKADEGVLHRWKARGGILGGIASVLLTLLSIAAPILAVLGKLKFLLIAGKFLLTGGSMLLSMWAYSTIPGWGWRMGIGVVVMIFLHECGHALAASIRGFKYGFMLFVPFMGAFVTMKGFGKNLVTDAFIGIAGPIAGTLVAVICALIYFPTGNPFWLVLAEWGFLVNLFNLLPTPPLDGGWIVPLFSPKLLAIGMVIAIVVGFKNPLIWLLLLVSIPRIVAGWKADPKTQPYYQVSASDKWKYGLSYIGLAAFLAIGMETIRGYMTGIGIPVM